MMKQFALCLLMLLAVATGFAQQTDSTQPAPSDPKAWSVIVLPDPQNYVKYKRNHPLLDIMMNWIDENRERLHIKMVLCTGDLVEHNDITNPDGKKMDQTGLQQWETIAAAFGKIDGRIPYIAAAGNHDYNIFSYTHAPKHTNYPQFFTPEKNKLNKKMLREYTNNPDNTPSLENSCLEFTSPQGKPFLFMTVEFAPRDTILQWAKKVVTQPKYKNHTVVLLTHAYLNYKNEQMKTAKYDLEDANYGAAIWEKLVKPAGNIQLVVSGHIGEKDNARKHVAFRTDKNDAGKNVQQMTFNAQAMGGGHYGNGGDGWLRIMEFMPDGKTVHVKTFSPFFAISPTTNHLAWRKESFDEFSFELN